MSFIYLAQPYTHRDPRVRAARFKIAEFMTAKYSNLGEAIYAPIVACHKLSITYKLPTTADFWERMNIAFMEKAEAIRLLEMPGWDKSAGVEFELDWWKTHRPHVPAQFVSWKEMVEECAAYEDDQGANPLRYYLDLAGANL